MLNDKFVLLIYDSVCMEKAKKLRENCVFKRDVVGDTLATRTIHTAERNGGDFIGVAVRSRIQIQRGRQSPFSHKSGGLLVCLELSS